MPRYLQLGAMWDHTTRANLEEAFAGIDLDAFRGLLTDNDIPGVTYAANRLARAERNKRNLRFPGPTIGFDFAEQQGVATIERSSLYPVTLNAGTVSWTQEGAFFNGSGAFQFATGILQYLAGTICDLSTLQLGESITISFVYHHAPVGMSGQHPIFYYGCSGENVYGGWGLVVRTDGKVFFNHRAKGSAAEIAVNMANRVPGANGNTKTAMCVEIMRSATEPNYFEVNLADRPLRVSADIGSVGFARLGGISIYGDGTGTGPATYSPIANITMGGKPGATYTNLTPQVAGASGQLCGLQQMYVQRYKKVPGRYHCILKDLAEKPGEVPTSLFMEA